MKNKSIWLDIKQKNICRSLDKDIEVDVLIIGGGITGISAAYQLQNKNLKVCLVEQNEIASGVTSKTTGKISYIQENIYSKISKYHGIEKAKLYLKSQLWATEEIKKIIKENNIDCNLEKVRSYVINNNSEKYKEELTILKNIGIHLKESKTLPNNETVTNAFYVEDTYVFHPLKYLYALKNVCLDNNILIFENTKIISIRKEKVFLCRTSNATIKAKYVVLALHYPYFLFPFIMPIKSYIEQSYIKATLTNQNLNFSSITITNPVSSLRYHEDKDKIYEISLANSHITCLKNNDKNNFSELINQSKKTPIYIWSNNDIMTNDAIPFIGSLNKENNLLIGTGYNTWGMTNGVLAGKILSDIILKKENQFINLFNPLRKMNIGKILNFPIIVGSNCYSFLKSKLKKQKNWYSDNVRFESRDGKNIAIYTDENKKEHIVYNVCPHLKCSLIFNELERTWDCPCHGSRFDIDGNVIEGPSNYNITYKE
ncbi:MAG: FAD-dependent oxidoreductase [Bacilli bacterium]|nr:FAD-dependent oxidoreductase [Bacilli bacterium]